MSIDDSQTISIPAVIAPTEGIGDQQAVGDINTVPQADGVKPVNDPSKPEAEGESIHNVVEQNGQVATSVVNSIDGDGDDDDDDKPGGESDGAAAKKSIAKSVKIASKAPKEVSRKTKTTTTKAKQAMADDEDLATDIGALALDDLNDTTGVGSQQDNIHIRVQQRNGRKVLTKIENIPKKYDLRRVEKVLKKTLQCGGSLVRDAEGEPMLIQLNGDHRHDAMQWILEQLDVEKDSIVIHGF